MVITQSTRRVIIKRQKFNDTRKFYICPVCHTSHFKKIFQAGIFSSKITACVCQDCGLVCLNPRWDEETYARYYRDEYYGEYQPKADTESNIDITKITPTQRSLNIFSPVSKFLTTNARILEVGCGQGYNLIPFRNSGFTQVTGLDPSNDCCIRLQHLGITPINKSLASYISEDKPSRQYDCVILSQVLEHFVEPEKYLTMVKSILSSKGIVYIIVPDFFSYPRPFKQFTVPHTFYYSRAILTKLLTGAGFVIDQFCDCEELCMALIAHRAEDTLKPVAVSSSEYKQVLSYLKKNGLDYAKVKLRYFLEVIISGILENTLQENNYAAIRPFLRKLHLI